MVSRAAVLLLLVAATESALAPGDAVGVCLTGMERTLLEATVREHSRKPDEFFALVEKLTPGSKIELFAREPREGWAAWGAEVDKFAGVTSR